MAGRSGWSPPVSVENIRCSINPQNPSTIPCSHNTLGMNIKIPMTSKSDHKVIGMQSMVSVNLYRSISTCPVSAGTNTQQFFTTRSHDSQTSRGTLLYLREQVKKNPKNNTLLPLRPRVPLPMALICAFQQVIFLLPAYQTYGFGQGPTTHPPHESHHFTCIPK